MRLGHRCFLGRRSWRLQQPAGSWRHFRQSKVENLGVAALGDENVRGLDVAVDDPLRMGRVERIGDLNRQTKQNISVDGLAGDEMLQRHPVEKLHDQEGVAILLPNFMNSADIGMIESGSRLRLPLEARQGWGVFDNLIGQKLQGHISVEGYVFCLVDHTHAATTEFLEDAVVRDGPANH